MKYKILYLFLFFVFLSIYSCSTEKVHDINEYRKAVQSNDVNNICEASYFIGELRDTISVPLLLSNLDDSRISHHKKYKGMSVYYCKSVALKKISHLGINIEQHSLPDSNAIKQFYDWAIKTNIISMQN